MAVVKIHSSHHVCVMLIGIVVSAIVFHPTQHCILKVGKFTRACPCRAFLQSLLSCLVHPYLLRNLFQLLFYSFRQVRFWAWIGATKMDPLGGTPSVRWPCLLRGQSRDLAEAKRRRDHGSMYFDIILHYAVQKDRGKKEGDIYSKYTRPLPPTQ